MSVSGPLTNEQIHYFKTHGYLILENLIDEGVLENWRQQVWAGLGSSLDTPDTWPTDKHAIDGFRFEPPEPVFGQYPVLEKIINQIGGGAFEGGAGSPIITWPEPDKPWQGRESGHIDAYGPGGWMPFMIGATTYLYEVGARGGGFTYWPNSHLTAHQYFRKHPSHVDGRFRNVEGWHWGAFNQGACDGPQEFTGQPGSVVLWHSYLTHGGSMNTRHSPRFGLFARWGHQRRLEAEFCHEIPEDLWKYWTI